MNGRVYDPVLGRFLSADPVLQFPENSQSYNKYSYVMNNPMRYVDPSGYELLGGRMMLVEPDLISMNMRLATEQWEAWNAWHYQFGNMNGIGFLTLNDLAMMDWTLASGLNSTATPTGDGAPEADEVGDGGDGEPTKNNKITIVTTKVHSDGFLWSIRVATGVTTGTGIVHYTIIDGSEKMLTIDRVFGAFTISYVPKVGSVIFSFNDGEISKEFGIQNGGLTFSVGYTIGGKYTTSYYFTIKEQDAGMLIMIGFAAGSSFFLPQMLPVWSRYLIPLYY